MKVHPLSLDIQKIYDKLVELLKGGKKLDISIDEIKKKAGAPNANNATVSALIIRKKEEGSFKNLTIKKFTRGVEVGTSKYDRDYINNKKFKDFYNKTYKTPWSEVDVKTTNQKANAYKSFVKNQELLKGAKGFTLTPDEMAKKLGVSLSSLRTYESRPNENPLTKLIANIKKKRTVGANPTTGMGETVVRYKDPGINFFKNWNAIRDSQRISDAMVNNIKEYDKIFRDQIKSTKKIPRIDEVIRETSIKNPTTIANTEALYSRALRGEIFRTNIDIAKDAVLGKKIIEQLAVNSSYNSRRSAFYKLALDKVDKLYPQKSGTLKDFKNNFRTELRKIIDPNIKAVPFSVNEVISLSAGESRGVQPFSVFVDVVETNINKGELAFYQGQFSKKLGQVQDLLSGSKPNIAEAEKIALSLDTNRKTLVNSLTEKGFTKSQVNQLNIPDIKVSKTIDPKHYTPEDLARWKKQTKGALDIPQFVKDKGYYIDIKKAKPFWESSVNNTVIAAAKNNVGNICNIFKGRIAYSADGGRIGFQGGCGREMTVAMQTDSKGTLQQITKTEGIIPKFKNVANGFLGALGKFKVGKYGAIAAAGAIAQPLIKQFMNDDPSTYLTDPDQQAGMLEALIEGERPKPRSEALDLAHTAGTVGATAAAVPGTGAVYKYRRGLSEAKIPKAGPISKAGLTAGDYLKRHGKGYGKLRAGAGAGMKLLSGMFTPAGILATEPLRIAQMRREGESWGEIAKSPTLWMGPAFAPGMTQIATAGMKKGSMLAKALRLGMSPAALRMMGRVGMPGLVASLGLSGYDLYKDYKKKRGFFARDED